MPAPQPVVFCPPHQKTEVLWTVNVGKTYIGRFSTAGVVIEWERNSALPPFHTWGTHNTSQPFSAVTFGPYTNFWFTPPPGVGLAVNWI
jgi:hypothetical protein